MTALIVKFRQVKSGRVNVGRSLGHIASLGLTYVVLLALSSLYIFVFIWTLYSSLKTNPELFSNVWALPKSPQWRNYLTVMTTGNMLLYFMNSVKYTAIIVVGRVILSSMAAYVLARFKFRLANPILYYFLSSLMVPSLLTVVPCFILMKNLGLLGSQWAYIILALTGLPFNIFVLIGFFKTLPQELADAAYIDGCGEFGVFWRIMLPLARPGLLTVAVINTIGTWNDFMGPLIFIRNKIASHERSSSRPPSMFEHITTGPYLVYLYQPRPFVHLVEDTPTAHLVPIAPGFPGKLLYVRSPGRVNLQICDAPINALLKFRRQPCIGLSCALGQYHLIG